jgi:hypothetical protein
VPGDDKRSYVGMILAGVFLAPLLLFFDGVRDVVKSVFRGDPPCAEMLTSDDYEALCGRRLKSPEVKSEPGRCVADRGVAWVRLSRVGGLEEQREKLEAGRGVLDVSSLVFVGEPALVADRRRVDAGNRYVGRTVVFVKRGVLVEIGWEWEEQDGGARAPAREVAVAALAERVAGRVDGVIDRFSKGAMGK